MTNVILFRPAADRRPDPPVRAQPGIILLFTGVRYMRESDEEDQRLASDGTDPQVAPDPSSLERLQA